MRRREEDYRSIREGAREEKRRREYYGESKISATYSKLPSLLLLDVHIEYSCIKQSHALCQTHMT